MAVFQPRGLSALSAMVLTASACADVVQYRLTFDSTWSAASHPTNFPVNPHFSALVGGTHGGEVNFWQPGGIASPGIELMAETGGTVTMIGEVQAGIAAGTAYNVIVGGGIGNSPGATTKTFSASAAYPLATVVSMVAPSPDWFVGVNGLPLYDAYDGWVDEVVIDLAPWDAGTDSGPSYNSPDADLEPQLPIANLFDSFPFNSGGYLGTFTFTRITAPCPADLDSDGVVDIDDLSILLAGFGQAGDAPLNEGDLDGDRDVDISDLAQLLSGYGNSCQ